MMTVQQKMTLGHLQRQEAKPVVKFGKFIVRHRVLILILSILLLIPSVLGYAATRVNYDILSYLPGEIDTMVGQDILVRDFGKGAFSMVIVEGMPDREVAALREKISSVDHVADVIWYDAFADLSVPKQLLPQELLDAFNSGDATMMAIFFDDTTSADSTMQAIEDIRDLAGAQCFISGMSAVITDIRNLSNRETPIYVLIAVVLCCAVLALAMDSFLLPVFFMLSIGMAVLYNLGSNYFLGEISYITKALSAVLQLGVTMDYSIFLWHSYQEQKERFSGDRDRAMAHAISNTFTSVVGSSTTTVAGFIALCFMSFTLGLDLGIVMAKGVVFGVLCCVTVLPSMILLFDRAIERTSHRPLLPSFQRLSGFIVRHSKVWLVLFLALLVPAVYGYSHTGVYYNLDATLPRDLPSIVANSKLSQEFDMNATHMLLCREDLPAKDAQNMLKDMEQVDGVKFALGLNSAVGPAVPQELIPQELTDTLKSGGWQLILVGSRYAVASDEVNRQIEELTEIIGQYDESAMLIGEAPCTRDLITITDTDFQVVSAISILAVFFIIAFVFRSASLPILLVAVIEFAVFINMGIPFYTGTTLPFIASVVIGTIQLGATVDYAILMTTRYRKERIRGQGRRESVTIALQSSIKSIVVSALCFFAATFGVGLYSEIDMISSLCSLMARGALISMAVVLFVLPSLLLLFDRVIRATSWGMKKSRSSRETESVTVGGKEK